MISINTHTSSNIFSLKSNQTAKEILFPFFLSNTYFSKRFKTKKYIVIFIGQKDRIIFVFQRKKEVIAVINL